MATKKSSDGLGWLERQGLKFAWRRAMSKEAFRRWVPLLSVAVLILTTVLHLVGHGEVAKSIDYVAGLVGLYGASPIPVDQVVGPITALVAALGGAWGLVRKLLAIHNQAKSGPAVADPFRLPRPPAVLVALLPALVLAACGSAAQLRLGGEPVRNPDELVVRSYVCRGQAADALRYLALPEFSWIGQAGRERYLADAEDRRLRGDCPCPTPACGR